MRAGWNELNLAPGYDIQKTNHARVAIVPKRLRRAGCTAEKRGQSHCCPTYSGCGIVKRSHRPTSRTCSLATDLKMSTVSGVDSRGGQTSSIAAGSRSYATLGRIVGAASSREFRVSSPLVKYVGQQWVGSNQVNCPRNSSPECGSSTVTEVPRGSRGCISIEPLCACTMRWHRFRPRP